MKPKLSIEEQMNHMKNKGILLNITPEEDAKSFISNNTYYFKIKAYAKNYPKNKDGKYVNLEFAALQELSVIDMHLRRIILSITLNVEHSIKTDLNHHLCCNAAEDGYSIVSSFRNSLNIKDIKPNKYTKDMIDKYEPNYAMWNYLELISFGTLCDFYKHYYDIYDTTKAKLYPFLYSIKMMRNIAAHNNCLLNNLTHKTITPTKQLKNYISLSRSFSTTQLKKLNIPILHDFAAMLYTFNLFIKSLPMKKHTYDELREYISRVNRHMDYFDKHLQIQNNLKFFEKLVDFFEKEA